MSTTVVYPIGYVSLTTGLSAHVLRAWERRYGAVQPGRSSSGRRLYSQEDIDRLARLKKAIANGHSISQIADLDDAELAGLAGSLAKPRKQSIGVASEAPVTGLVDECLEAVTSLDNEALLAVLTRAELHHNRKSVIENIIVPFMAEIGRLWRQGQFRIAHEHLASATVGASLSGMLMRNTDPMSRAPRILIAAPAGQYCRLGALAVAVIAQDCGWRPIMMGADLPVEEIASAGLKTDPQMIALSLSCRLDNPSVDSDLQRFGQLHANRCPFVVGGAASSAYGDSIKAAGGKLCVSSDELVERFL